MKSSRSSEEKKYSNADAWYLVKPDTTEKVEPGKIPEILVLKKRLSGFVHAWIKYGLP